MTTGPGPRERLIAATQTLIADSGWASATTRRIASRAGLNPGVVHYHVDGVDALRREAILRGIQEFFEYAVQPALPAGATVETLLAQLFTPPDDDTLTRLLHESLIAATHDEHIRSAIATMLFEFRSRFGEHLRNLGVKQPVAVAATIVATLDGFVLQRSIDPALDPGPIIDTLARLCHE